MNEIITQIFDFSEISDVVTRRRVIDRDARFDAEKKVVESGLINMGRILIDQKADLDHGQWMKWLESKGLDQTKSQRWMQITKNMGNYAHVHNLSFKVLSLLAQDNTPEPARQEAVALVESGEKITHAKAKELIDAQRALEAARALNNALNVELKTLRGQIPTQDVKSRITELELLLRDEKARSGEAMKTVIKERQDMAEKIKRLKDQQAEAIKTGVKTEIDKLDKLISEKQNLAASIETRVNELREARRQIDKNVEIEEAYKAADKEITSALYRVAIVLKDVLEDYPMPEKFEPRFKKYMSEMQNGINYINSYFEQGEF